MTDLNVVSTDDLVVAMDLGTSKFKAAAGVRVQDENGEECVELLCYNSEPSQGVKRGRVHNLETSASAIKRLLLGLENQLNKLYNEDREGDKRIKLKIKKVCVGLNGKSIKTTENKVLRNLGSVQGEVTEELMDSLYDEAKGIKLTDAEILKVVQQEFLIDDEEELEPIGCLANRISGRYKIVSGDPSLRNNLRECVNRAGYELANSPLSIEAAAVSVLSEEEEETGCAVFDFGGGTTSVAVYNKNVLRDLLVAPFGGGVITSDICSLKIPEVAAERLKTRFGSAVSGSVEDIDIAITSNSIVNSKFLAEVIESRVDEIVCSIWNYLEKNYSLCHINEIVLTGNASLLGHLQEKMTLLTGVDVRIGKPNFGRVMVDGTFDERPEFAQLLGLLELAEAGCVQNATNEAPQPQKTKKKHVPKKEEGLSIGLFGMIKRTLENCVDKVYEDDDIK